MKRTIFAFITILMVLSLPLQAPGLAADNGQSPIIQPMATMSCSVSLSKHSSSELQFSSRCITTFTGICSIRVTLQRLDGGSWKDYSTYSSYGSGQYVSFNKKVSPPKGYTYRCKATFNTDHSSTVYSNSIGW